MHTNLDSVLLDPAANKKDNQWKKVQYVVAFSAVAMACMLVFAPESQLV